MIETNERAFLASLDSDPGLFTQVRALFRGPIGKLAIIIYIFGTAAFIASIWAVVRMAGAGDFREALLWFALANACWTSVLTIKLWVWNRLNALAVLRQLHAQLPPS